MRTFGRACLAACVVLCGLAARQSLARGADGAVATAPRASAAAFLYQPASGVLADVIPFYWDGKYHLLYLQIKPGQKGFDWAQIVTRDFTSYEYTGVGVAGGGSEDAVDRDIFTGSVFEKDGSLYAFYTGHNGAFARQHKPDQVILRAVSRDGVRWTKEPQFHFSPEGSDHYRYPGACRDPFVFWNPERNEYGMVFCAAPKGPPPIDGLAYAGSSDLAHWRLDAPFAASGHFPGYECPDLFRLGGRWVLLFSTYDHNPGWATRYLTAASLQGPWLSPRDDFFDGGCLYAAKTASDGRRRFLCGTLPSRKDNRDGGDNGWGGRLVAYEILSAADGSLATRIPAEVEDSFGAAKPIQLGANPSWQPQEGELRAVIGQGKLYIGKLPPRCLISVQLTVPPTGRAGLWLGGDAKNEQAFRLAVDVSTQRVSWDRGSLPIGPNPERERAYRPLKIQPGDRITVKVALDGDAAVACVNDTVCLATRIYDRRQDTCGIWSDTVGTGVGEVQLRSR
jgi:beta-fructofuranosidase